MGWLLFVLIVVGVTGFFGSLLAMLTDPVGGYLCLVGTLLLWVAAYFVDLAAKFSAAQLPKPAKPKADKQPAKFTPNLPM